MSFLRRDSVEEIQPTTTEASLECSLFTLIEWRHSHNLDIAIASSILLLFACVVENFVACHVAITFLSLLDPYYGLY